MATATQSKQLSAEHSERPGSVCCSSCSENGDKSTAGHYCVDCEMYLCSKCLKCHSRISATKSHQVNDVEYAEKERRIQQEDDPSQRSYCHKHLGDVIDSYCMKHEELCCGTCVLWKHRACQVKNIAMIARDSKSSPKLKQYKKSLSNILIDLNQEIDVRMKNLASLEQDKIEMLDSVDKYEDDIIAMVTTLSEMSRKQIRDKYETHKKELDSEVDVLKAAFATTAERVDTIILSNDEQLFTNIETGKLLMKESEQLLIAMSSDWIKRELKFRLDETLKTNFDGKESFGKIQDRTVLQKSMYVGASLCRTMSTGLSLKDRVFGICTLESGDIFLTDTDGNSLKRYSSEYKLKESIDTPIYPVAVCRVSANAVAVRSFGVGQVLIISVRESMKVESYFEVDKGGLGLTYDATDAEFFVCEKTQISVYSKAGNKIRTHEKTSNGEQIFLGCMQIAIDTETKNIYVTDSEKGLIILYRSGNIKSTFTGLGVKSPWAICKLPGDIYLVNDTSSKQLVQFNRHGIKIGILIEAMFTRCAVYDHFRKRLIVVDENTVKEYTLSATCNDNVMP